jgi:hypothetical protein
MGSHVHPETYLRLACEDLVRSDLTPARAAQATAIARVLVAAGSIEPATVGSVFEEYNIASQVRVLGGATWFSHQQKPSPRRVHLSAPQRVAVGPLAVGEEADGLVLLEALFDEEGTHLEFSGNTSGNLGAAMAQAGLGPGRPTAAPSREPDIVDDQGGVATAKSRRERNWGTGWEGKYVTDKPLSASTAWLEIDGRRVVLPPPAAPPEVRIEVLPGPGRSLEAALRRELMRSVFYHWQNGSLEAAAAALVATGVVTEDDAVLHETARIAGAIRGQQPADDLPEPWASLLKRIGKQDGPVGTVPIGAALNSVEGWSVRFGSLWSESSSFAVSVALSPRLASLHFQIGALDASTPALEWWAEDDSGNNYLGSSSDIVGSHELAEGKLNFRSPLDPKANQLSLLPTGTRERGIVTISLDGLSARWRFR